MYNIDPNWDPTPTIDPYKKLLVAICARSLMDLFSENKQNYASAHEWFFVSPPYQHEKPFFSFSRVCQELGLNKKVMRDRISELLETKEKVYLKMRLEVRERKKSNKTKKEQRLEAHQVLKGLLKYS